MLQKDAYYQLLVDKEQVSLDGMECNKIGTSYSAFNTQQANACSSPQGTCLSNQIKHLRDSDIKRY
jgi:hypothetical protein